MELRFNSGIATFTPALFVLAGCQSAPVRSVANSSRPNTRIHIVATTDVHGYLEAQPTNTTLKIGGVDVMQGYFDIARAADPETLFLDSGDLFQGTIISNSTEGATVVKWMNFAGYYATAIGNHDFDFGPGGGTDLVTRPGQDPLGALKARESQAHFKFLSSNICSLDEDPGQCTNVAAFQPASFATPYLLKTINGVNLGIIGITTPSTPETTLPSNVSRLKFMPIAPTLDRYVPIVRSLGADGIIVVMHEGGFCQNGICSPSDPLFSAIDSMLPQTRAAITVILAGHTHNYVNTVYNGVHTMINGRYGSSFGYVTLDFDGDSGNVTVDRAQTIDFCARVFSDTNRCTKGTGDPVPATFLGHTVTPDPAATRLLAQDIANADAVAGKIIGSLATPLTKNVPPSQESSLGELMADSFRNCADSTCTKPADIAFQNDGGIRTSQIAAGLVNYGEIFQLDPFEDYYTVLMLTGSQVHDLIDAWWAYGKSLPQVSGIQVTFDPTATAQRTITNPAGQSKTVADIVTGITMADGTALDETRTYKVVTTDFLATGGSGSGAVVNGLRPQITYSRVLRDCMIDWFKANPNGLDYSKMGGRLIQAAGKGASLFRDRENTRRSFSAISRASRNPRPEARSGG